MAEIIILPITMPFAVFGVAETQRHGGTRDDTEIFLKLKGDSLRSPPRRPPIKLIFMLKFTE